MSYGPWMLGSLYEVTTPGAVVVVGGRVVVVGGGGALVEGVHSCVLRPRLTVPTPNSFLS